MYFSQAIPKANVINLKTIEIASVLGKKEMYLDGCEKKW